MPVVKRSEGRTLQVLQDRVQVKLPSSQSPTGMAVVLVEVPPEGGTPPHSHPAAEEGYFVLAGTLHLWVDGGWSELTQGDFAHVPPGAVHAYQNRGTAPVKFLAWTVGGAMDDFFADVAQNVRAMPRDAALLAAVLEKHSVHLVG